MKQDITDWANWEIAIDGATNPDFLIALLARVQTIPEVWGKPILRERIFDGVRNRNEVGIESPDFPEWTDEPDDAGKAPTDEIHAALEDYEEKMRKEYSEKVVYNRPSLTTGSSPNNGPEVDDERSRERLDDLSARLGEAFGSTGD